MNPRWLASQTDRQTQLITKIHMLLIWNLKTTTTNPCQTHGKGSLNSFQKWDVKSMDTVKRARHMYFRAILCRYICVAQLHTFHTDQQIHISNSNKSSLTIPLGHAKLHSGAGAPDNAAGSSWFFSRTLAVCHLSASVVASSAAAAYPGTSCKEQGKSFMHRISERNVSFDTPKFRPVYYRKK